MLLKISVRMASKTITDDYDGLHKMFWDEINKTKDKKLSAIRWLASSEKSNDLHCKQI